VLPLDLAISHGVTGPSLRGSGLARDLRRDEPFGIYDRFEFDSGRSANGRNVPNLGHSVDICKVRWLC